MSATTPTPDWVASYFCVNARAMHLYGVQCERRSLKACAKMSALSLMEASFWRMRRVLRDTTGDSE